MVFSFILFFCNLSFAGAGVSDYLCELGKFYYSRGQEDEALHEFNKALLASPDNTEAKGYVAKLAKSQKANGGQPNSRSHKPEGNGAASASRSQKPQMLWDETLNRLEAQQKEAAAISQRAMVRLPLAAAISQRAMVRLPLAAAKKQVAQAAIAIEEYLAQEKKEEKASPAGGVKISGVYQLAIGGTSEGFEWKRANGNLNEEDTRILSSAALNNRENTFDPRIFDRLKLNIDTRNKKPFNIHANIVVDPWSFTGKSEKFTLTSANGTDTAELELKYWSNTRRTFNEIIFTPGNGDSFALPEIKVEDNKTAATSVGTLFGGTFNFPSVKIKREFQPLRELWFDYKTEKTKFRFFPLAYSDQALTSDDPLNLSNHHVYWEESPWILRWEPGRLNANPNDFSRGRWSDSLAFSTRDSDLLRLTALRGFAFDYTPGDETSLRISGASPKGLWQDYDSFDNVPAAMRFKQMLGDNLQIGTVYTFRLGLNEDKSNKKDAVNHVWGMDFGFSPLKGTKLQAEVAASRSEQDLTSTIYASKKRGFVYQAALIGAPDKDILSSSYNEIKPEKTAKSFLKSRLQFTHMDEDFEPALANYRETRDDQFWSRHIHFRKPFKYSPSQEKEGALSWDDIAPFAIGDGIDIGRDVFGLRIEASTLERKLDELFDVRNVHRTNGKYVENVARSETTYKPTEKLTAKLLAIYHNVHQTYGRKDPFLVDAQTDRIFDNTLIPDSKSPSMKTFSLGANYDFSEKLSLYGIWDYSNDINAAYDGFPRGILNSSSFETFSEYGRTFRRQTGFVYNQYYLPLPPYPFNNTYKAGLTLRPWKKWELFLDYTRNEYEYAGQISDDINHSGIEISFRPAEKLGFFAKYVYSQVQDLVMMDNSEDVRYENHHNFSFEARYSFTKDDEFTFQFGDSGRIPIGIAAYDPFGGSLSVLDTQAIYRLYYRRKF